MLLLWLNRNILNQAIIKNVDISAVRNHELREKIPVRVFGVFRG